jgi:20S proteasome alpha/beta subunit
MFSCRCFLTLLVFAFVLATNAYAQQKYPVTAETNVAMKTRDGVVLRADIYRKGSFLSRVTIGGIRNGFYP